MTTLAAQRQQFAQQANENTMVQKVGRLIGRLVVAEGQTEWLWTPGQELALLDDEAKVFKLVGPVLLKQDVDEAKANVDKRLEFINNELCVACIPRNALCS